MKISFGVVIFFTLCIICQCANITNIFQHSTQPAVITDIIQAQDIGDLPASYFVCKLAFRQTQWVTHLQNCNCRRGWYRWRYTYGCHWCPNYFYTKVNSLKITYCHYADWGRQIEKVFQTGKPESGNYREVNCPKDHYANKIALRFGTQHGVKLGLNGALLKCQTQDFKSSVKVQDNYNHWLTPQSQNEQNAFISSLWIRYQTKGILTGLKVGFEPMIQITSISFKYEEILDIDPVITVIESTKVANYAQQSVQSIVTLKKNFTTINRLETNQTFVKNYKILDKACVNPLPFMIQDGESQSGSLYTATIEKAGFNQDLPTVYVPSQQLTVLIPSGREYEIKSVIKQQKVNLSFEATLNIIDQYNKVILNPIIVKGMWKGVMTFPGESIINSKMVSQKSQTNN